MSDKAQEAASEMKASAELTPIIEGVQKIADHVTSTEKRMADRIEQFAKDSERRDADLEDRTNKTVESIMERLERFGKASSVLGKTLNIEYNDDGLKEVLTKKDKGRMGHYERLAKSLPAGCGLSQPLAYAAAERWFKSISKGKGDQSIDDMEAARKAYRALQDSYTKATTDVLQEGDAAEGGNLVPTIVEADVARLMGDAGKIWPRCRQMAMTSWKHAIPNESTAVAVAWITEETAITIQNPEFNQITIQADKLAARAKFSLELLQDSSVGLLAWLLRVFSEKMARELDYQAVLGDGTAPELLGVLNGVGINAITSGTAAGRALTWPLLTACFTGASEQAARDDGVWIMSPNGYAQVIGLVDSNNQPIVHFGTASQETAAGSILGKEIIVSAALGGGDNLDDSTNTATKILFGPLSTFTAGTRMGMSWDVTDQVSWANYQADARLVGRFGGRVTVPGAWTYLGQIAY